MRVIHLLAAIFFGLSAVAQQPEHAYTFSHLDMEDGLAGNHVSAILQDKKGFIWIASTALQRFDGENFLTISNFDRLPGSIYYEDIALFEDHQGRIWMGTPDNIRVYDPVTAKVTTVPLEPGIMSPGDLRCHAFLQDHNGVLWLTTGAGLLRLDAKNHLFRKAPGIPDSLRNRMRSAILEDASGRLWISGIHEMYMIPKNRKEVFSQHNNPEGLEVLNIPTSAKKIFEDHRQRLWIASRGLNELYAWHPDTNRLHTFAFPYKKGENDQVYDITEDIHEEIWIAMEHGGLHRYNEKSGFNLQLPGNNKDPLGLHYDYETNCLLTDRDGHLWVGTDRGVNIMSLHNQSFTRLDYRNRPLPQSEVTGIQTTRNGDVFIGYWGKGFAWLGPDLRMKAHYTHKADGSGIPEERSQVWSFAERQNGSILIGQENGYISEFNPASRRFKHYHPPGFSDQTVLCIWPENDSLVWVGLYKLGIVRWNMHSGEVTGYKLQEYIHRNTSVIGVVPQGDYLWLASSNGGILRLHRPSGKLDRQIMFRHGTDTVRNVTALLPYSDSVLIAGTDHGIFFYNHRGNFWEAQTINDQLFDEWILSMQAAGNDDTWFATPFGFYRLNGKTRALSSFVQNDDIIDNSRKVRRNIVFLQDGRLLVGASDHAVAFSAFRLEVKPPPPDVSILDFRVLNHPVNVDSALNPRTPLKLTHHQNYIGIEFKSLQYHAEKTQYYYKLEGLDKDWIHAGNLLVARYTNLPPGEYIFRVKGMNMAGVFSRNVTSLYINVLPAFWQTWWFRLLFVLVILSLVYGYFRVRMYLVRKEAKSRAAFREELAQLEMKALRAQMNPHFIFNALNSIQTFMMKNETEQALAYLSRFARLIRNVLDHSQLNSISITRETDMLENYLELERLRLSERFDYRIMVDPKLEKDFLEIPAMVIQPFVENAIWHGLQHKNERGLLTIEFIRRGDQILCIIEDNGIGRDAATTLKQQSHPTHISRGVQITKDRLQIYNSRFNMDASFDIEDLKETNGNASGTRVNLWFPLLED
ncbi:ligand-binding sensor domain-containing protein [Chitinophaga barathri]|uniref:Signal transduction histidine kinase internal region domain-containing protein n=1 Tax=Chitinophaga barathri TaxID=1647451 RepID=A0A3N4MB37_9BACT|nr:sensor histidine kinase [Chitinophaga barathri]RPD38627.1 hypothetical protein EG028_23210 [Chitinophaga barathri]